MITHARALAAGVLLAVTQIGAHAAPNLVTNGDFEINGGTGQIGYGLSSAAGWTSGAALDGSPYTFNFIVDTTADDAVHGTNGGFASAFSAGAGTNIFIWGPDNGVNNGFTGSSNGGYFLGADGDYARGPVSQVINGLTVGDTYTLNFEWAASQFTDVIGDTTQQWQVSFGSETHSTSTVNLPQAGFSGWMNETMTFTATATSQTLTFLANGAPSGLPPFLLLDGVSMTGSVVPPISSVPEPTGMAMLAGGLVLLAGIGRRRRVI